MGHTMKTIKYLGITTLAVTLVMLSIGSIPQSFAGTDSVNLQMNLGSTCGISVTGIDIDFGNQNPGATPNGAVSVENTGTSSAQIDANAGDVTAGGGFANAGTSHIAPLSITLGISPGTNALDNTGADVDIGDLFGAGSMDVDVVVTVINQPVPNNTILIATINLSANC